MTTRHSIVHMSASALEPTPADNTKIGWMLALARATRLRADVLGFLEGCTEANEDCALCWAREEVYRRGCQKSNGMKRRFGGLTRKVGDRVQWANEVRFFPEVLGAAVAEARPSVYFAASRSDIFHRKVKLPWIVAFLALAALRTDHLFVFPTKRWSRAREILTDPRLPDLVIQAMHEMARGHAGAEALAVAAHHRIAVKGGWPLHNVWIGASLGIQHYADEALPHMREIAAAGWTTWVSSEPRRGPINWSGWEFIAWLVTGGQSGSSRAAPMHSQWVRDDRSWTSANSIAWFLKQWGEWIPWDQPQAEPLQPGQVSSDRYHEWPGLGWAFRLGTSKTGHTIDGEEHLEVPHWEPDDVVRAA